MKKNLLLILKYFTEIRFIPLIIFFYIFKKKKNLSEERSKWFDTIFQNRKRDFRLFIDLLQLPEFRSVVYFRLGGWSKLIRWMAKGQVALYFSQPANTIKPGLIIQHRHSTRIGVTSIGYNCQI